MRRIVVSMQNFIFADAIATALSGGSDYMVHTAEQPEDIPELCRIALPQVLLMEVAGHGIYSLDNRLRTRTLIKKQLPECKIVLLVDENTEKGTAEMVKQAKKDGLIEQFFYGSISASYLVALLDTL